MGEVEFEGKLYYDERMYVLSVCKCTVAINDNIKATRIHHDAAPKNHKWCVVTYQNYERFPPYRVDCFDSQDEAIVYMQEVEPQVPLTSLGGQSPRIPLPYSQFVDWKKAQCFEEYDYRKLYPLGVDSPEEVIYSEI